MMATTKKKSVPADDYMDLIRQFPLVRIKDDRHLRRAHELIDELSLEGEDGLTAGQLDYLLALGDLTTVYEQDAQAEMLHGVAGLDLLKAMAEEHDLTASDIGRIVGQREVGSKVLKGERQISKTMARAFAERFGVAAELFLR
jgi:antitoxin component HigA of HigAB toxin-antitoxin module